MTDDLLTRLDDAANDTHYIDHETAREAAARIREFEAHGKAASAIAFHALERATRAEEWRDHDKTRAEAAEAALATARQDALTEVAALMKSLLERAETAEADARSWRTVALSNQAIAQSYQQQRDAARVLPRNLTPYQIDDACMSYRHDFGLMSIADANQLRFTAGLWWTALTRAIAAGGA